MDGILIINKPKGITSQGVVSKVKKILNIKKVGHAGTLDPNATGVLPILIGKGTKISKYLIEHNKKYRVTIKLGIKTTTADCEGDVINKEEVDMLNYTKERIQNILNSFLGVSKQIPPMYSAIKVNGKKLYEYARNGENVEVKSRDIEIYDIALKNIDYENKEFTYTVKCSKGTYIRTLCEDISNKLGTIGYMKELTRLEVDKFKLENAITLEFLEDIKENNELLNKYYIKIEDLFIENDEIMLERKKMDLFLNGVKLEIDKQNGVYRIYDSNKKFIGLGEVKEGLIKRDVII